MRKLIRAILILAAGLFATEASATSLVDFLKLHGITYISVRQPGRELKDQDLASDIAKVKFKVEWDGLRVKAAPSYRTNEGYAAWLEPGTSIYAVKGYATTFRVAARRNDRLVLFEADTNPNAKVGADLLDLANKVDYIGINADEGDAKKEIGAIKDRALVGKLVHMALEAPVNQRNNDHGGARHFIVLHFSDGTATSRAYWLASGQLSRGIMLAPEFAAAIKAAVEHAKSSP